MPINKIVSSFDKAVADIPDGATIMIGGFGTVASTCTMLLEALARKGIKNLTTISNSCGFGRDVWKLLGYKFPEDIDVLVRNNCIKKAIASAPVSAVYQNNFEKKLRAGEVELEMVPQGTLAERIRAAKAGLGGIYTPVGVGTIVEKGKEAKVIDGKKYVLELPIKADFALIKAHTWQGTFGDPYYGGNQGFVGWDLLGYPGVRTAVVPDDQRLGTKPVPLRRSAYDSDMFNKA